MANATLSARVAKLEQTVASLVAQTQQPGPDEWKKVVGMFDGDEVMKRIVRRGAAIRQAERRRARKA